MDIRIDLWKWAHRAVAVVIPKNVIDAMIGHGLSLTMWNGWYFFINVFLLDIGLLR